ncbi:MAG: hypothetical protein JWR63_1673 [Conexibacter sp.]|nr:hypothetical protein [Conexibacter sp.]
MITSRDTEVVDWIGRLGAADPGHVMARFGMGRTATYRRLAALEAAGLVERSRLLHAQPGLTAATRAGLRLCGLEELGVARVSAASVAHWHASTTVAVLLERRHGPGSVGGVREIRAAERTGREIATAQVGATSHLPDLVVWGAAGPGLPGGMAVEVELTAKAPRRLEQIVRGWRRAVNQGVVSGVLYVCSPEGMRAVERAVAATEAQQQVRIAAMPAADVLSRVGREPQPATA